jgi:hypothetical protein
VYGPLGSSTDYPVRISSILRRQAILLRWFFWRAGPRETSQKATKETKSRVAADVAGMGEIANEYMQDLDIFAEKAKRDRLCEDPA